MTQSLKWRLALVSTMVVLSLILLVPSVFWDYSNNKSRLPDWWNKVKFLPKRAVVLGLDLQGGLHLVIGVNTDEAIRNELIHIKDSVRESLRNEKIAFEKIQITQDNLIEITFPDLVNMDKALNFIRAPDNYGKILIPVPSSETLKHKYKLSDEQIDYYVGNAIQQVLETLTSRIDEFGVAEPSIQRQGKERIVLQLPGIKEEDRKRVMNIIQRTAKLEFMLVESFGKTKEEIINRPPYNGLVPMGMGLYPQVDENQQVVGWYLLREEPKVTGDYLVDARVGFDQSRFGGALVNFQFNFEGARRFSKITGEHIGEHLAIVLEGNVKSAPVIRDRIFDRGVIEGNFTPEEAKDLALVLRAGALPVGIRIEEQRNVGATLGVDLIKKGKWSILSGGIAVMLFMVAYYSLAGFIADFVLLINLVFIMSALAMLRATLTLPGIAGIALTIGMAVDANIIIYERIREELRAGRTPRAAVDAGFKRSLWTILDANITTLICGAILFQVGTGPVRGFAVTLTIGVISTVFSSIVITRMIYDLMFARARVVEKLNIGISV